jgi:pathogenesis-related protein 1
MTTTRVLATPSAAVAAALLVAACSGTISPGDGDDSTNVGGAGGSDAGRGGSAIGGKGGTGGRGGAGGATASGGSSGNGGSAGRGGSSGTGSGGSSAGRGGSSSAGNGGSSAGRGGSSGAAGSGNAGSGGTSSGEPAALAGILDAHNAVRAAKGIVPLTWDPALAAIAQRWVEQCIDNDGGGLVDHNPGRSEGYPTYVGENIYASSGTASGTGAVSAWASEEANYNYASNSCASGKVCGHYTQIVWAKSTKLGCAIHRCAALRFASSVVCNYAPGGNFNGERPY